MDTPFRRSCLKQVWGTFHLPDVFVFKTHQPHTVWPMVRDNGTWILKHLEDQRLLFSQGSIRLRLVFMHQAWVACKNLPAWNQFFEKVWTVCPEPQWKHMLNQQANVNLHTILYKAKNCISFAWQLWVPISKSSIECNCSETACFCLFVNP